eukprot:scaffold56132_cov53-Prasinocladus_malaysianus.AAC.1
MPKSCLYSVSAALEASPLAVIPISARAERCRGNGSMVLGAPTLGSALLEADELRISISLVSSGFGEHLR